MNPDRKAGWLQYVDEAIAKRQKTIEETRRARNSADSPMTSRYDTQRDIFNNDLNINLDGLEADQRFREEIAAAGVHTTIEPGAQVTLTIEGSDEEYLYMQNFGRLPDIGVITPKSPIGEAIAGKKIGETVFYSVNKNEIGVKINNIE